MKKRSVAPQEGWKGWDDYAAFYDWENAQTVQRRDVAFWQRLAQGLALPPPAVVHHAKVVIAGGGMAGLAAAHALELAGVEGVALLPSDLAPALEAFESSDAVRRMLGDEIVRAVLAVRRWELDHYGETPADELPERFRFGWSI